MQQFFKTILQNDGRYFQLKLLLFKVGFQGTICDKVRTKIDQNCAKCKRESPRGENVSSEILKPLHTILGRLKVTG